ncbi:MAG TPA: hypothetical protein VI876_12075 [Dehalococcoidia bacterium]|nr:hypothetical protein [Dehalococcoidia bacterium]
MRRFGIHRRLQQLVLDGLFVALLLHFFVTGHVVPPAFVDLFRDQPAVVVVRPVDGPQLSPDAAPATNDSGDETPGT